MHEVICVSARARSHTTNDMISFHVAFDPFVKIISSFFSTAKSFEAQTNS